MSQLDSAEPESPRAAPALAPGTLLAGVYQVLRPLAVGGMATVYEVEHQVTGAHRALKVLRLQLGHDTELAHRLIQEARVGTRIRSEHVADIIDAGVDATRGIPFIVMELLDGVALSEELRTRGHFSPAEVLEILRQLCHALGAAHDAGIVHLDLKPANLFLARSCLAGFSFVVKVLDFGIAQVLADTRADSRALQLGTPAWMAPEQTEGDAHVSPRTDVWALGLLAYALLTGRSYWRHAGGQGGSTAAVLREVIMEPIVSPRERAREQGVEDRLPARFEDWFLRCVTRDPRQRFPDARLAYEALQGLVPSPPGSPPIRLVPTCAALPGAYRESSPALTAAADDTTAVHGRVRRRRRPGRLRLAAAALVLLASLCLVGIRLPLGSSAAHGSSASASATAEGSARPAATVPVILRVHGSNTIGAELAPALAEAFLRRRLGGATVARTTVGLDEVLVEAHSTVLGRAESIAIAAHGSSTAFKDLGARRCELGMASRPIRAAELLELAPLGDLSSAASEHTLGLDGIAVIVNPRNPVSGLTREQVAQIFAGQLERWSQVGGSDTAIKLYARDDRSGTYDTFRHLVLAERALAPRAERFEDSGRLADAVAADPEAIGFVGLAHVRSTKPLLIRDGDGVPLLPAPVSVATEDYLLARRLYLYSPSGATPVAREFVDFALSDAGQAVVERAGFVDLLPECDARSTACVGCSDTYRYLVHNACRLSVSLRFDRDGQNLDTRALRDLTRASLVLSRPPLAQRTVVLIGFADTRRGRDDSVRASQRLAELVGTQLRARGVNVAFAVGLGKEQPLVARDSPDAEQRNRRVEVWLR